MTEMPNLVRFGTFSLPALVHRALGNVHGCFTKVTLEQTITKAERRKKYVRSYKSLCNCWCKSFCVRFYFGHSFRCTNWRHRMPLLLLVGLLWLNNIAPAISATFPRFSAFLHLQHYRFTCRFLLDLELDNGESLMQLFNINYPTWLHFNKKAKMSSYHQTWNHIIICKWCYVTKSSSF